MLRRIALIAVSLIMLLPVAPAQADPLRPDHGHWGQDCPYGLTLRLGGGGGWRHYMRRAADEWNVWVAPNYWAAPRITRIVDVPWDTQVQYYRCTIDFDEPAHLPGGYFGWANSIPFPDNHHYAGGMVQMSGHAWNVYGGAGGYADFLRLRLAAHELHHAMGLGHNPVCSSLMNQSSQGCTLTVHHNYRDRDTLRILYSHKH